MRIDLHDQVYAICARLGVNPSDVYEIRLLPASAFVVVYKRNTDGRFYTEGGETATTTLSFPIST